MTVYAELQGFDRFAVEPEAEQAFADRIEVGRFAQQPSRRVGQVAIGRFAILKDFFAAFGDQPGMDLACAERGVLEQAPEERLVGPDRPDIRIFELRGKAFDRFWSGPARER